MALKLGQGSRAACGAHVSPHLVLRELCSRPGPPPSRSVKVEVFFPPALGICARCCRSISLPEDSLPACHPEGLCCLTLRRAQTPFLGTKAKESPFSISTLSPRRLALPLSSTQGVGHAAGVPAWWPAGPERSSHLPSLSSSHLPAFFRVVARADKS